MNFKKVSFFIFLFFVFSQSSQAQATGGVKISNLPDVIGDVVGGGVGTGTTGSGASTDPLNGLRDLNIVIKFPEGFENGLNGIGDITTALEGLGGNLSGISDAIGNIGSIFNGDLLSSLIGEDFWGKLTGNFSLFGLETLPSMGIAAAIGVVAIPVAISQINNMIKGLFNLIGKLAKQLWDIISGQKQKREFLAAFKEAKKNWFKLKALGRKIDERILQNIQLYYVTQKVKTSNHFIAENGYRPAINGLIYMLEGLKRKFDRQLDQALETNDSALMKKLNVHAPKFLLYLEDAKRVKKEFKYELNENRFCHKLSEDILALKKVEGEIQKSRAHILGARDYWQQEWKQEYDLVDKKFKRVQWKSKKFYRTSISMAKKAKRKAMMRLKRERRRISAEVYAVKEQMILETELKTIEKANNDKKHEYEKAKRLYVDMATQFGEYESFTKWFSSLIDNQFYITSKVAYIFQAEEEIEDICVALL